MANSERPADKRKDEAPAHPVGSEAGHAERPKGGEKVERASGRYSASEQSEEKMKDREPSDGQDRL